MDLAYVDKLAKDNDRVKYLLVRHDLFDRTLDAKGMNIKHSKEKDKTFSKMITKNKRPQKTWAGQGTAFAGEFKVFLSPEVIQNLLYNEWNESSICRTYNKLT